PPERARPAAPSSAVQGTASPGSSVRRPPGRTGGGRLPEPLPPGATPIPRTRGTPPCAPPPWSVRPRTTAPRPSPRAPQASGNRSPFVPLALQVSQFLLQDGADPRGVVVDRSPRQAGSLGHLPAGKLFQVQQAENLPLLRADADPRSGQGEFPALLPGDLL